VTTTTKPTVKEAKQVIDNNYQRFMDGQYIDPLALDIIGYSVANELQLRDYLLGYAIETGSNDLAIKYVAHLIEQGIAEQYRHAFYTVLSALYYMEDDRDLAHLALSEARMLNPTYPLFLLLVRVYGSGWPTQAFKAMTYELHPKVLLEIEKIADNTIHNQA
jgi:hypothetical protein